MTPWRVPYPKFGVGPALDRLPRIAARLGLDLATFGKTGVVIVGSNGKGSTAAMTAALLQQHASPVGLFTSPHMLALNERFRIDGADISDGELACHWGRVRSAISEAGEAENIGGFEFLFLIAADWFQTRGCAHTVWEAGIGGRLDPVRLIEAQALALTSLDLEHVELLGPTRAAIAREKVQAAPQGATLFVGESCHDVWGVIEAQCALGGVTPLLLSAASEAPPLAGAHQAQNMALALALARSLAELDETQAARGLAATRWPGRLETLREDPLLVIDVGHTPAAAFAARDGFLRLADGVPSALICGVSRDKKVDDLMHVLAPAFGVIVCAASQHKGTPASELAVIAAASNPAAEILVAESVEDARRNVLRRGCPTLVAGSLFLAAEFKASHLGLDPASLVFF